MAEDGSARGCEHGEEDDDGGTECGWSDEISWTPVCGTLDVDTVSVDHGDFAVEFTELGEVDSAVFVDPVVDECAAFCGGGDDSEEGEAVDVEAGKWHGVDFVGWGDEVGFMESDVDEACTVVVGEIFVGEGEFLVHEFESFEFDGEELDWGACDCNFGFSDDTCSDETHGFDRVFAGGVFDGFVDF